MVVFTYDKTFEGLLTALFEAYYYKIFPDLLWAEQEPLPLFYDRVIPVYTDEEKSKRVWQGLRRSRRFENLPNLEKSKPGKTPAITIHPFSKNGRRYIFRRF